MIWHMIWTQYCSLKCVFIVLSSGSIRRSQKQKITELFKVTVNNSLKISKFKYCPERGFVSQIWLEQEALSVSMDYQEAPLASSKPGGACLIMGLPKGLF